MTPLDDSSNEMRGPFLDQGTADRLLAGLIEADDAPPGYAEAARVVRSAGAFPSPDELVGEIQAVTAVKRLIDQGPARPHAPSAGRFPGRSRTRSRFFRAKVAGLVVVGTLAVMTELAAAGVLPNAAQKAVSIVLSKVGVSIPASPAHPPTVTHPASTGGVISQLARTTTATGVAKGAEISSLASGGISRAGQHPGHGVSGARQHHTGGTPPVSTPNTGGTGTADQASGGKADTGTAKADAASQGHSSAGSGNAAGHKP